VEEFASGDLVCGDCGLVLTGRIIDTRSEWRTFANEDGHDPSRVGSAANMLLSGSQLDTRISMRENGGNKDGVGISGAGRTRELNKIQGKLLAMKGDKQLVLAYQEISAMCDRAGLPRVISDIAKQLFKRTEDAKLLRGKTTESIIAACIFIACRQENVPRTFKEICALTKVPKKDIGRCFKILAQLLDNSNTSVSAMSSEKLMSRFCHHLGLPMEVERAATELIGRVKDVGTLAGKSPVSIAAACIYMVAHALGHEKSAKDIGHYAGVSEVTIRNSYKSLYQDRHKLLEALSFTKPGMADALPSL
jgi:transcription initiation factor TFIIB